jgi:hypothetical protein
MTARDVVDALVPEGRPRLRGWLHLGALPVAAALGVALVAAAPNGRGALAAAIYASAVVGLFAASALYHRGRFRPDVSAWLRRVDHSMIYVLIAGTYTPICLLVLDERTGTTLLVLVWSGALAGAVLELLPWSTPRWLSSPSTSRWGGLPSSPCPSSSRPSASRPRSSRCSAACSTPPARSSTGCAGPTRRRASSATTRSSTVHARGRRGALRAHRLLGAPRGRLTGPKDCPGRLTGS